MFNKLKSSSSSKNSSNIPNSLFSSKMKAIKAAVISGFMLIWWNASANNDIQDTKSLEIGDSISQKLWTTIKIQGDLATLGISSISRNTAEKVINAGSVVTALKLLDLDSSVKSRKKYIEILGLGVDLSIDENWKVIDREKNKEANNTFYRSIITSINESVIQAEKNQIDTFKILIANPSKINQQEEKTNENNISLDINSANVSSDGKQQAGWSITSDYWKTQINVSNSKNSGTNIQADHLFDNGVKVKVQDSKSNSNIGLATEVWEDFYVWAQVWDNPAATLEYTKDEYSAWVQAGKEWVWATMWYNDEDTSVSLNKTIQWASARAIQQFDIFGNELAASWAVNYSNAKELWYNLWLDYYMPNTAFGLEYEKFLEKSEYAQFKLTQRVNDYLIARFWAGVYEQHGFEYNLENLISDDAQFQWIINQDMSSLPSGEYSEKQNNAFAELHYYPKDQANSSVKSVSVKLAYFDMAANKLDTGFRVAENNEITIVDQINISTLWAETFTAEISSQFKLLDNLSSTFSVGWKFVNYWETYGQTADSEQYLTYKWKISYLPTESLLLQAHYSDQWNYQESGLWIWYDFGWKLSPVLWVTHISGENIKSDNVFGLQFKADLWDVFSTKSTVRSTHNSSMNETKRLQAESKIVYEREHLMDLYKEVWELYYESNDDKLIGKYNIKIPLGVALTGELRTNKPELDQYFEARWTELHILNAAISLKKYAGEKIEIIADQVGTQIMHVKLPTLEGSTIYKTEQHIWNLHKNSENEFLFNDNKIETELYAGNLNILTVNNIFNGTILSEIIIEGFLKNLISSEVLNYISDNISSINQEELLLDIQNWEVISIWDIDENINNAPVANNDSFTTAEDTEKTINFTELLKNDTDKESQWKLEITHVDGIEVSDSGEIELEHGVLKFIEWGFTFIPTENKSGVTQIIEYRIEDEGGKANVANIEIEILEKNDAPEIILENINLDEEGTIIIAEKDIAVDIDTALEDLNFQVLVNGLKVDTEFTSEWLRVTGLKDLAWNDIITLQVSDDDFDVQKEISIKIKNINDAPVATYTSWTTNEDVALSDTLTATDSDGDSLTFSKTVDPTKWTVVVNTDGTYTYTSNSNENGIDTFEYGVNDGTVTTTQVVTVTINAVDDLPTASNSIETFTEDSVNGQTFDASLNFDDVDGDIFTFATSSTYASVDANTWVVTLSWVPANYTTDIPVVVVGTSNGQDTTSTITVKITADNDAPVATYTSWTTNEDVALSDTLTATDSDGDSLTFSKTVDPTKGTVIVNTDGTYTYTSNSNVNGTDSFEYGVNDGTVTTTQVVTVTINAVNDIISIPSPNLTVSNVLFSSPSWNIISESWATDIDSWETVSVKPINVNPEPWTINWSLWNLEIYSNWNYSYIPNEWSYWSDSINVTLVSTDGTEDTVTLTFNDIDNKAPGMLSQSFASLDTKNQSGSWTITFDENLWSILSIQFTDASFNDLSGTISGVINGGNPKQMDVTFTAPNVDTVYVSIVVADANWKTWVKTKWASYDLFDAISSPTISMSDQIVNDNWGFVSTDLPTPSVWDVQPWATYEIVWDPTWGKLTINSSTGIATRLWDESPIAADYSITIKVTNTDTWNQSVTFNLHVNNNA